MRGEATVDLGAEFSYPIGQGQYGRASSVTVRAPGLTNFNTQARMQAFVLDALFGVARKAASLKGVDQARKEADEAEQGAEPVEPDPGEFMDHLAVGLGTDAYPEFVTYAKKVLTSSPYATIGDGDQKGRLTDEAWNNIEQEVGIDGVMRILGTFSLFFATGPKSKKPSGNGSSTSSLSPTKGASAPSGPKMLRSRN